MAAQKIGRPADQSVAARKNWRKQPPKTACTALSRAQLCSATSQQLRAQPVLCSVWLESPGQPSLTGSLLKSPPPPPWLPSPLPASQPPRHELQQRAARHELITCVGASAGAPLLPAAAPAAAVFSGRAAAAVIAAAGFPSQGGGSTTPCHHGRHIDTLGRPPRALGSTAAVLLLVLAVLSTRSVARRPRCRQLACCGSDKCGAAAVPAAHAPERLAAASAPMSHETVVPARLAAQGAQGSRSLLSRPGSCHKEDQDWRLTLPRRDLSTFAGCMEHVGWRWGGRQGLAAGAENGNHPVLGCGKAVSGGDA